MESWPIQVWAERLRALAAAMEEQAKTLRLTADQLERRFGQISLGGKDGGI